MARGGRRKGAPGKAYSNRSDLAADRKMPVAAPTGMGYGERKALEDAQRAVPVASPGVSPQTPPMAPGPTSSWPIPGSMGPLDRPSERPNEPLTAGLPIGAGPGPEALGMVENSDDPLLDELRAAYMHAPSEALRELIEELES